ncbi:hypothetical protein JTE90_024175 [Oedothorax gibbosus]|uniref:Transposase n=1 Tax=Oedothorax gibbosus TaxID=931172 RepID=A0AAV6UCY7_9ARAC|nr:hypothetical protein JTE90_024175 [Oedothorax gibbosus]
MFGKLGSVNRCFALQICSDSNVIPFLRELGLIKDHLKCPKCSADMKLKPERKISDNLVWICRNSENRKTCGCKRSLREDSWFRNSKMTLQEVFLLTYELVKRVKHRHIIEEYGFAESTICVWRRYNWSEYATTVLPIKRKRKPAASSTASASIAGSSTSPLPSTSIAGSSDLG